MTSDKMGNLLLRIFVALLGLLLTLPSVYKIGAYAVHRSRSIETVGEVVKPGRGMYLGCRPFIAFHAGNKDKVLIRSNINYYVFFCPRTGDRSGLSYRKDNPEIAMLSSNLHNFFMLALFVAIGAFFLSSAVSGRIGQKGMNGHSPPGKSDLPA